MAKRISRRESDGARRTPRGAGPTSLARAAAAKSLARAAPAKPLARTAGAKPSARRAGPGAAGAASAHARGASGFPHPAAIFDPVARALDWLGDKWTLVIVRHLLLAPCGFQELRRRTGIAPRVLSARLRRLRDDGLVVRADGERGLYAPTPSAHDLAGVISAVARWYVLHAARDLELDVGRFSATSAQSIMEALPFLLREDRARGVQLVFEVRLTGEGGGVWTVAIDDGQCRVHAGFAPRADVQYTADARAWCALALGFLDPRDARKRELLVKQGGRDALDHFFHQIARPDAVAARGEAPRAQSLHEGANR